MIVDSKLDEKLPLAPQVTQVFVTHTPDIADMNITNLSGQFQDHLHIVDRVAPPAYDAQSSQSNRSQPQNQEAFRPMIVHSRAQRLGDGFFAQLPPTDLDPHPFIVRSVHEVDWKKFLTDVRDAAKHEPTDGPRGSGTGKKTLRVPPDVIDRWNTTFFNQHGIEVVLAKGPHRLSGDMSLPPPDFEDSTPGTLPPFPPFLGMPPMPPMGHSGMMPPIPPVPPVPGHGMHAPPVPPTPPFPPFPHAHGAHFPGPMGFPFHHGVGGPHFNHHGHGHHHAGRHSQSDFEHHPHHHHHHHHRGRGRGFGNSDGGRGGRGGHCGRGRFESTSSSSESSSSDSSSDSELEYVDEATVKEGKQPTAADLNASSSTMEGSSSRRAEKKAARSERKAERREKRSEKKAHRRERKSERAEVRFSRKMEKYMKKMEEFQRRMSGGGGRGRGGFGGWRGRGRWGAWPPAPFSREINGSGLGEYGWNEGLDGEPGYYRLIIVSKPTN